MATLENDEDSGSEEEDSEDEDDDEEDEEDDEDVQEVEPSGVSPLKRDSALQPVKVRNLIV